MKQHLKKIIPALLALSFLLSHTAGHGEEYLLGLTGASNDPSVLYVLDPATGAIRRTIGATGQDHLTAMAYDSTTETLYAYKADSDSGGSDISLFTLSLQTGQATRISLNTGVSGVPDMTLAPDGTLYAWYESGDNLVTVDKSTGVLAKVGDNDIGTSQTGLAFDRAGVLYLKTRNDLYVIDPSTGIETSGPVNLTDVSGPNLHNLLDFSFENVLYTGDRSNQTDPEKFTDLYTADTTTGLTTLVGRTPVRLSAIMFIDIDLQLCPPTDTGNPSLTVSGKNRRTVGPRRSSINLRGSATGDAPVTVRYKIPGRPFRNTNVDSNGRFSQRIPLGLTPRTVVKFMARDADGDTSVERIRILKNRSRLRLFFRGNTPSGDRVNQGNREFRGE